MSYDDIVPLMGGFGRYQRAIHLLLCLTIIGCGFHYMAGVFQAAKTDYRCLQSDENPVDATYLLSPNLMAMIDSSDNSGRSKLSRCDEYDSNLASQYHEGSQNDSLAIPIAKCDSFVYDKSTYELTTTMEFDLICGKEWLRSLADSVFMLGVLIGAIVLGGLSDKYGRKRVYLLAIVINLASGLLVAASPEYISYLIFKFIVGSSVIGIYSIAYVFVVEMVDSNNRIFAVTGIYLSFAFGSMLTAGFAYFITNWRILQIVITLPSIAFLSYWWFIPESVRWLLNEGRVREAKNVIKKAASMNGVELSEDKLNSALSNGGTINPADHENTTKKYSIFHLFKYPNLRRKTIVLFWSWFVITGTYYGLAWNSSNLTGNIYINFVIAAAVDVPAHIFSYYILDRWGRKVVLSGFTLFTGIFLLLATVVPDSMPWLVVCLAMSGKSAIAGAIGSVYIFTSEQYPTTVRNLGLGSCSTFARIAGILVPYINETSNNIWKPLPFVVFGLASLVAGMSISLLPETLNQKLPETIEEGEQFGKDMNRSNTPSRSTLESTSF